MGKGGTALWAAASGREGSVRTRFSDWGGIQTFAELMSAPHCDAIYKTSAHSCEIAARALVRQMANRPHELESHPRVRRKVLHRGHA